MNIFGGVDEINVLSFSGVLICLAISEDLNN